MIRRTAIWMTMAAAVVLAGCSSRRGDQLSQDDYPYAGPPSDTYGDAGGASSGRAASSGTYASRTGRDYRRGGTDYYGRWAYSYGRDPSYDYYLASSYGGYDDDYDDYGDDEYGYPVTVSYFYDELDPYGDWYDDPRYGWVWYPEAVSAGWRPYLNGYWVYTDWGWAWVSDDPWGADPYHYGRWACDASNRWMWVPDDVWAPAWVSWRYGGGYAGWAPLPPEATWDVSFGIRYADDFVAPSRWCFVPESRLTSTRLRTYVAPLRDTRRIYTETRDLTRYASVSGRVAERGLRPALIERATGRDIPQYRLTTRESGLRRDMVRGRTLVSPMPVLSRGGGRGRAGGERLTSEMRTRRDRFEREMRVRGGRLERGQRVPPGRGGETQARGRIERGAPVDRQGDFERPARMGQGRQDQMREQRARNAREERAIRQQQRFDRDQRQRGYERQQQRVDEREQRQRGYERQQQQQRYDRQQQDQQRYDRQQQLDRGRSEQRRRDRAEAEGRARADQQAQRDQARQQAEQARYERQQADQARYERQQARQQAEQDRYQRQQQQQDARARQEERRQQQVQQQQQEQPQQQQERRRGRQDRGNSDQGSAPSRDQGSDQGGHGRGRGHNH
ncbi:MAG TPA: DUF6600 domain-containing protein [Candidatus Eisenbacteria bacterium]|nr:DUF6600 domain-containing protein [Candidatus Eisenbacteria bacterium]